jgi:hypothetical protein
MDIGTRASRPFGLEFLEDQTIVYSKSPYASGTVITSSLCSSSCPQQGGEDVQTDYSDDAPLTKT